MPKKFIPIPYELFPKNKEVIDGTNCLAFALGIYTPRRKGEDYALEKSDRPIEIAFLNKVLKLGYDTRKFKRICREDESKVKGYIIRVYDFANITLSDGTKTEDFHVLRRETNGQWVHKPGFGYSPRKVTMEDWRIIVGRYGNKFVSFAIDV